MESLPLRLARQEFLRSLRTFAGYVINLHRPINHVQHDESAFRQSFGQVFPKRFAMAVLIVEYIQ